MSSEKSPMSTSYKIVFVLSLLMIFVVIIGGFIGGSKSVGFGIWYWGYTAWLMFKRDNVGLVSLQKIMLWIQCIAFAVVLGVLLFSDSDVRRFVDITPVVLIVLFIFSLCITYLLHKFFLGQGKGKSDFNFSDGGSSVNDTKLWEQVSEELKNGKRIDSLWTRAFADADGDSSKANARYIKLRIEQLSESFPTYRPASKELLVPSNSIGKSYRKRIITIALLLFLLVIGGILSYKLRPSNFSKSTATSYLGISLNSSMDEVTYTLGIPTDVLVRDDVPFKLADGTTIKEALVVAAKDEIYSKGGINNFLYWQYNLPEYRIDVSFDPDLKRVDSIGCYVAGSSSSKPKECDILGIKIKDDEVSVLEKLGRPEKEEINGVTKTLYYNQLNLQLLFEKRLLYYVIFVNPNRVLSSSAPSRPSYDDVGWTQESTGSKELGPWLKYSPKGTRYCRNSDGTIQRLYPPGVKPNAEKANPFCLGDSTSSP
jgi:hypothetical protein